MDTFKAASQNPVTFFYVSMGRLTGEKDGTKKTTSKAFVHKQMDAQAIPKSEAALRPQKTIAKTKVRS